ncbi:Transcription factor TFIID [anaerobic digester metagenome]
MQANDNELIMINIVVSAKMNGPIDIDSLATSWINTDFNPEIFPGLIHKMKTPKATVILFQSGKITSVGSNNIKDAELSIRNAAEEIKWLTDSDTSICSNDMKIENIVFSTHVNCDMDFDKLKEELLDLECELKKNWIIIRNKPTRVIINIFRSGKISIMGAKSVQEAQEHWLKIKKRIIRCSI